MRTKLNLNNFIEELQDYIADNAGLGYTVSGRSANLYAGGGLNIDDLSRVNSCTLYDEGLDLLPGGKAFSMQERPVRFAFLAKSNGMAAVNRAFSMLEWIANTRRLQTTNFTIRYLRLSSGPTIVDASDVGTFVADFVVVFLVTQRT